MAKNVKIEAEGAELIIKNKAGDYAIVPKEYRTTVQKMINDNCHSCIDALVNTLPVMNDYAQDGSLLPAWNIMMSANIPPSNVGPKDYTSAGNFGSAYQRARQEGQHEFVWNNKRYNSDIDRDRLPSSFNLSEEQRRRIYHSVNPTGYPMSEAIPALKRYLNNDIVLYDEIIDDRRGWTPNSDAWAFYLGLPQENNTVTESQYRPSNETNKNSRYYTIRSAYPDFDKEVIKDAEYYLADTDKAKGALSWFSPLENVTYSKGSDERGNYFSIYDIYDFSIPFESKIGKPYEIYDRVYYRDYGGGKKPMYYTDHELDNINIDKMDFNTLALQKELINRGYPLPQSTKEDGSLDGIFGEETKNALLAWQRSSREILDNASGLTRDTKNQY